MCSAANVESLADFLGARVLKDCGLWLQLKAFQIMPNSDWLAELELGPAWLLLDDGRLVGSLLMV